MAAPPPPATRLTGFAQMFHGSEAKSAHFGQEYGRVAVEVGCHYLDSGTLIRSSDLDGIHWEPDGHRALGQALVAEVCRILG